MVTDLLTIYLLTNLPIFLHLYIFLLTNHKLNCLVTYLAKLISHLLTYLLT